MPLALRVALLGLVATATAFATEDSKWRFPTDRISSEQWAEFRAEVLAKPGIERQEFANQLVLTSNAEFRVYVFTQPGHPAHPAVVVRAVVAREAGSEIQRMGHYAGDQEAFDKWWHEFDALDNRLPGNLE